MKKVVCLIAALLLCFTALGERTVYAAEPVLTVSKKTIYVGTDYQIRFKKLASAATVTYKSSNKKVATVNSKGLVTPVAKGTATLTVVIKQGGKSYTRKLALTVKNPYVRISNKKTTLVQSSDYQLPVSRFPACCLPPAQTSGQECSIINTQQSKKNYLNNYRQRGKGCTGKRTSFVFFQQKKNPGFLGVLAPHLSRCFI